MTKLRCLGILSTICLVLLVGNARADSIELSLVSSTLSGAPGTVLTFMATLTNEGSTTIFLNGDSFTTEQSFLVVDDSAFFQNAPLSLAPGQSSGPFPLFSVLIGSGAIPGNYNLNSFSILGGTNSSATMTLLTQGFQVTVTQATAVPEPGYAPVLLLVLSSCAWLHTRKAHCCPIPSRTRGRLNLAAPG